ncbi:MAG: hypothetical protein JOY99_04485 [Sphingomonadaceae bacterium]|nr:hypothetical protein [Sphingomonadaceae bacterium]
MIPALALLAMTAAAPATTATAPAAAAAAAPARPAPPTPAQQQAILQQLGFSPAGITILMKSGNDDAATAQAAAPDIRAGNAAIVGAIQAAPFNEANFETQLRNQQTRVTRLRDQSFQHQLTTLHSLPAADQLLYAKLLVFGVRRNPAPQGAAPAPAAPAKSR